MSWTVFHKRGLEGFRNEFFQKVFRLNMDGDLTRCWSEIRNVSCFKKLVEKDQRDTDGADALLFHHSNNNNKNKFKILTLLISIIFSFIAIWEVGSVTLCLFIERYSGTPPTNQYIQPTQYLLFNMYNIYSNLLGKGVAWISPIGESCETLTLLRYRSYRCFVLEIGRIIYDILGLLNFWNEFFKKVNSLDMDGAMSQLWSKLGSNYVPRDILEISAIWEGRGVLLCFPVGKYDRTPVYWSDGGNKKQKQKSNSKYILILLFSDLPLNSPHNNRPSEWNCVSHTLGRCDILYHLIKNPTVGFCMLPALRSSSRHFLSALMLASMLPLTTIMHYIMLQINHESCFTSFLREECLPYTLKSDGSILSAILMLTLVLIISFIKAKCFLLTRTQQYLHIENYLSLIPWGSDSHFLLAMMFTLLLTTNSLFFKVLFFTFVSLLMDPLSPMPMINDICGAYVLGAPWCNQYQGSRIAYMHKIKKFSLNFHHEDSYAKY